MKRYTSAFLVGVLASFVFVALLVTLGRFAAFTFYVAFAAFLLRFTLSSFRLDR